MKFFVLYFYETALHIAIENELFEVVKVLLQIKDIDLNKYMILINLFILFLENCYFSYNFIYNIL